MDNFPPCEAFTLSEEGGYSDNPRDPGGATNHGITQATLSHWRGVPASAYDVINLTTAEASAIARALYWNAMNCAMLPCGVDLMVYDFGFNAGPKNSIRELQACVGVAQDGAVGPMTALTSKGAGHSLFGMLAVAHENYYRALDDFAIFGTDWLARLARCSATAEAMTADAQRSAAAR